VKFLSDKKEENYKNYLNILEIPVFEECLIDREIHLKIGCIAYFE